MNLSGTSTYRDGFYTSQDNLRLYYRDYGDVCAEGVSVLCLAGMTRNSRDFDDLASILSRKRRVLALDYRGRGRSEYDADPNNYLPQTYVNDVGHLLTATNCHKVVVIGTSLGGVIAMALGAARPTALAGVVLNDVGPDIDAEGLDRIRGYIGRESVPSDLEAGARQLKVMMGAAYPEFTEADWLAEAKARYNAKSDGSLALEYDPNIAKPFAALAGGSVDLWPLFRSLKAVQMLAIRGATSDILSLDCFNRMRAEKADLIPLTVPNRGHVPLLSEPICTDAIERFLEDIDHAHR